MAWYYLARAAGEAFVVIVTAPRSDIISIRAVETSTSDMADNLRATVEARTYWILGALEV